MFILLAPVLYGCVFYMFYKLHYKAKPAIYVTNDYYAWKGGDTYQKYRELGQQNAFDVVILGSSRAYRGYSPFILEKLGFNAINIGTAGQSIKNAYFLTKNYIDSNKCKLLILDVYLGAFVKDQLESCTDLTENIDRSSAAYDIAFHNKDVRVMNIAALRWFTEKDSVYYTEPDYQGKGFAAHLDTFSRQGNSLDKRLADRALNARADREQMEYFKKLVELADERDIKMVCVYSPTVDFYDMDKHREFVKEIVPIMAAHHIPFYDRSKCDSLETYGHFFDPSHLNLAGVERFNNRLYSQLMLDGVLRK